MAKAFESWTVLPHGPLEKLETNLWRVQGSMPMGPPRVMVLVRLGDGRLIVHNAIALEDALMKEIEAWGTPAFLVVPNAGHRMDAKIYKARYPKVQVICPAGARAKVQQVVPVDATEIDFGDPSARYVTFDGTNQREGYLEVRSGDTVSLVINDLVSNMRSLPGFSGMMAKLLGFTGSGPKLAPITRRFLVTDRGAARAHMERLATTPALKRVIVSHGDMLSERAAEGLRAAAATV
jgi:hypothetical protein